MTAASVNRGDLTDALTWVAKVVPTRPANPVFAAIRLAFGDGELEITAFDYEVMHQARVPAIVASRGQVLVPGLLATHMVSSLRATDVRLEPGAPGGSGDGWGLTVTAGRTTFHLPELPLGDYPELPTTPPEVGRVPAGQLADVVRAAGIAAGHDDMLPQLTGIHLVARQDQLTAEATDRFRAHRATCRWQPTEEFTGLVPGAGLRAAVDGLRGVVSLGWRNGQLGLSTDSRTVTMRALDSEFPKLSSLIPAFDSLPYVVDVDVDDLRGALSRAQLALDGNSAALLVLTAEGIEVTASLNPNAATGAASDVLEAGVTGIGQARTDPTRYEIGFNPRFYSDALASLGTRRALLGFHENAAKPGLLIPHDPNKTADQIPDTTALVMPRRVLTN